MNNTMKFLATAGTVLTSALAMAQNEAFVNEWDQVSQTAVETVRVAAIDVETNMSDIVLWETAPAIVSKSRMTQSGRR